MRTSLTTTFLTGLILLAGCAPQTQTPAPAAAEAARSALAARLHTEVDSIQILEAEEKEWSDSCLGLGGLAESCLAAITPGYEVRMSYQGTAYTFRTNMDGSFLRMEE